MASSAFELLHPGIQEFIWSQGWASLREVQEMSIEPVLAGDCDLVIAAETAAGKTEAAFLPALSSLLFAEEPGLIIYVSPIKALINDQFQRLTLLCQKLEIPVWPWHGDITASVKAKFRANPVGVLLITPESLEAMLCMRGSTAGATFGNLRCFIVDEMHAFIGTERGKQLQSLMRRIDLVKGSSVPRIGLSATLGDMALAGRYLRPGATDVRVIQSPNAGSDIKLIIKGFEETFVASPPTVSEAEAEEGEEANGTDTSVAGDGETSELSAPREVAEHLFSVTRGSNNLIFPNSRQQVEQYTVLLNKLCDARGLAQEFWPHHGSLSKELRRETEQALKRSDAPASAVCTNTLELGIDIGAVKSVVQIGSPFSVASLRQRLGRSGRRAGEPKILRGYSIEQPASGSYKLNDLLRLDTVQLASMVKLLLDGWFEPPVAGTLHYSTLVQQLLSFIAQQNGATPSEAFKALCGKGAPFEGVASADFALLLRHLSKLSLLTQESGGELLHGTVGERQVNHYSFYAAFKADEEFRLVAGSNTIGALPVSHAVKTGQKFLFAGKAWRIENIDVEQKVIHVSRAQGGAPPLYTSGRGRVHGKVRDEMRQLLAGSGRCPLLDAKGQQFLDEGRSNYRRLGLEVQTFSVFAGAVQVFTWDSDAVNATLASLLQLRGFSAWPGVLGVEVSLGERDVQDLEKVLRKVAQDGVPSVDELLADAMNLAQEKWDWALPHGLLVRSYASSNLDVAGLGNWLNRTFS